MNELLKQALSVLRDNPGSHQSLMMSLALLFFGLLTLILWMRVLRLHRDISDALADAPARAGSRSTGDDFYAEDLKYRMERSLKEMLKALEEERARINNVQRMLIEFKDKHLADEYARESRSRAALGELEEKIGYLEGRFREMTVGPADAANGNAGRMRVKSPL